MNSTAKITSFFEKKSLTLKGKLFEYDKPLVMGIINITKDSFYSSSRVCSWDSLIEKAGGMLKDGADIIDVGAMSTRPGAKEVPEKEEVERLSEAIKILSGTFPQAIFSVDTYRSKVALKAVESGAHIINDISAGAFDENIMKVAAEMRTPYIMMHTKGKPETMQQNCGYENMIREINIYFAERIVMALKAGINDIIIDPGFGFGKTLEQNYELLNSLSYFGFHNIPLCVGISRKSMIYKHLNISPDEALGGTIALNTLALMRGASILRVHDVKEASQLISLISMLRKHS